MQKGDHFLSATRWLLIMLIFLMPLFFLPITLEPLETNKQTLLLVFTCATALCWIAHMLLSRHVTIRRGWMNLLPWFLVLAFIVPAMYSVAPYLSWVGAHRSEYTSVLTVLALAVLFYLLGNTMGSRQEHRRVHLALVVSTSIVALIGVLQILGVDIFSTLAPALAYNTVGTPSTFIAFLITFNAFFSAAFLSHRKGDSLLHEHMTGTIERILTFFVGVVTFFFLLILDDPGLWMLFSISLALIFIFVVFRAKDIPHPGRLSVLGVLFFGGLMFWFFLPGLNQFALPLEVTPNTAGSLIVAEQTLSAFSSSWGSGPGTYVFDYSRFHDLSLNEADFWNTRFDRAISFVLTLVPTIGVFGVTMLGLFVLFLAIRSLVQVVRPASRQEWLESFVHVIPWLTLVVSAFLVSWNMTLIVSFGIFSGLLASQVMRKECSTSLTRAPGVKLVISTLFVLLTLAFFIGIFVTSQRYLAEIAFTRAAQLDREGANLQQVVTLLDRAATLNPSHDTYYRNLGEALLLRVDEELHGVRSIDTLTQESAQYIQSLVAASVNAVVRATDLSPHNVLNWLSRGFVYRELIPVLGEASEFAVMSYQKAIELEPLNPENWTQLGRAYLAVAEHIRPLTVSPDVTSAEQAQTQLTQLLTRAQEAFEKSVELKPNYAPAHFQLAVTFERQGRLDDAIGKMERVAQYNQLDVGVFFQLGMLYLERGGVGDMDHAQAAFEHAIKLAPGYANAHWFLASIYEQKGDMAGAVREVEVVLELNPGNDIVELRLEGLLTGQVSTEVPEAIEE
ncbi:tetratricopeptide repeat protein [Patescibacteria group bacterium]|nr:MAG: tetratricopeptide repeat protein [Patescibacteria group bacterium]